MEAVKLYVGAESDKSQKPTPNNDQTSLPNISNPSPHLPEDETENLINSELANL